MPAADITNHTEQVAASAQETTASSTELVTSAESLAETADGLRSVIGRFTIAG
jgi:methyl-accepting chemotaxis protein